MQLSAPQGQFYTAVTWLHRYWLVLLQHRFRAVLEGGLVASLYYYVLLRASRVSQTTPLIMTPDSLVFVQPGNNE